ncbi:MAG: hypothetical protein HY720_20585 [Planctomycetes bacterium]|nr:hypothetical protein [Planctomycetota bacterium]
MSIHGSDHGSRKRGYVLFVSLIVIVIIMGMAGAMLVTGVSRSRSANWDIAKERSLQVAEGMVETVHKEVAVDMLSPVSQTSGGNYVYAETALDLNDDDTIDPNEVVYERSGLIYGILGASQTEYPGTTAQVVYYDGADPVKFSNRTNPTETFSTLRVLSTGTVGSATSAVQVEFELVFDPGLGGAIISDFLPTTAPSGSGKGLAQQGHVVFDSMPGHHVEGNILANGGIFSGGTPLTDANVTTYIPDMTGAVQPDLAGTGDEIPDYTAPGSPDQLFDFGRFIAVAQAGGGYVFNTLQDFADAMNAANVAGVPLEGVIVLNVDPVFEGHNPKIYNDESSGQIYIPEGINIRGTLLFNFAPGTDMWEKVFIETPLYINLPSDKSPPATPSATGSGLIDPADSSTWTSGYSPTYTEPGSKYAWQVDISGYTDEYGVPYVNFTQADDLPALMFNTGVVDIHQDTYLCGVTYGPSFAEIENKHSYTMVFVGSIIIGNGAYLEAKSGTQVFKYDANAIDRLATMANKGKVASILSWQIKR